MDNLFYILFAASLQNGYIGNLIDIVRNAGGERCLYEMSKEDMESRLMLTGKMAGYIIERKALFDYENTVRIMERESIEFIRYTDKRYPKRLGRIASRPYGLFVKGNLPKDNRPSVAIVGARDCSEYGRLMAEYFGDRLAKKGINIISGMAYGVDGISQMAALDAGGKSYGILGCGVDIVYPKCNRRLYERLTKEGGLLSEYLPGTEAQAKYFPPRNRIISGLSDIILVVEARAKSGTLITVDLAIEQNKEVMVIPGRITDPLSVGCLNLMKAGASPALSIEDVTERLGSMINMTKDDDSENAPADEINSCKDEKSEIKKKKEIIKKAFKAAPVSNNNEVKENLSDDEALIFKILDYYPKNIEEISGACKISITKALAAVTGLEIKGLAKAVSQGSFIKNS